MILLKQSICSSFQALVLTSSFAVAFYEFMRVVDTSHPKFLLNFH